MDICEKQGIDNIYNKLNETKSSYPMHKTICQLFEAQAEKTPDAKAVIFGEEGLTYRELNKKAGQLAYALHLSGVEKNGIIGIMVERSLEMIIGIYGILKYGASYLPISPEYPQKRINYIVYDSNPSCLIGQSKTMHRISGFDKICINLDDECNYELPECSYADTVKPNDLMYIIYTSGSTGNPKGVMVEQHSVVNRLNWMQKRYPITHNDTILQKTSFVFDVSVWELFWWSITGAKVSMLKPGFEKFPQGIIEEVEKGKITIIHFVPSMFNSFLNYISNEDYSTKLLTLKHVFCSGEALTPIHVKKFNTLLGQNNGTRLVNLYGPTEATVDVTYYECPFDDEISKVPIGKPIDNTTMYILREACLLPPGEKGELCIGGVGLARGYLNQPELTNEKFVDGLGGRGEKVYRTGDYACLMPDGNINYLGRMDNQVKIRGLRIELGEIEAKICEYESVSQCIVALINADSINPVLKAYILTTDSELAVQKLKKFLRTYLPDYMIPNDFVMMKDFPITMNGKVDRKALVLL